MMVSSTFIKLRSPLARSCLIALSGTLLIDAILTIGAAIQYPYLIDYYNDDLYIASSRTISIVYSGLAVTAILLSISTAIACYKNDTNYVLIHSGITGVFLPVSILVYFMTVSSRYKSSDYLEDFKQMIADYRISQSHKRKEQQTVNGHTIHHDQENNTSATPKILLSSFVNLIDSIQTKFSCCGVESHQDWSNQWHNYLAPTCCKESDRITEKNSVWATSFNVDQDYEFKHCTEGTSYSLTCSVALKEDEASKYAWLSDLIIFMIVVIIANTIVSLLFFGLTKTEDSTYEQSNECELSMVGVSVNPGAYPIPTITSIRHRPSVVATMDSTESISARAQAVRFNISQTPRTSISGPSKFSAGARRGSSFI